MAYIGTLRKIPIPNVKVNQNEQSFTKVLDSTTLVDGQIVDANSLLLLKLTQPFTITLPTTPSVSDIITIIDSSSIFNVHNLTILRNNSKIMKYNAS
jgi:hypothetical protein